MTATVSPGAGNLLYPGGNGDVVVTITNPNAYSVTITAVTLLANTDFASGFSDAGLTSAKSGCSSSTSVVTWNYATSTSGSIHTLTAPLTVAGNNGTLVVTLTNDASMGSGAPSACQATYFSMPPLAGVTASGGSSAPTSSPATDSWTS